ncbi:hypothetical protein PQC38_gp078 [Aeromonas phage BUCT695]|nr:hypothetical protein PQC38_gp078 [Aeromonas phage BUCT695]UIW10554.1 hypothetical protein [Aeromonas phage BUCT695]
MTERYEEESLYSDDIQRRYREKLLQKIPLYGIRNTVSGDFG